jgi:UDP-GlcNAc:undecaprenyl-phosphate GlcNAc-1-phosphate transferase
LELLNLDFLKYTFVFPADLITIIWILVLINALNWMCGIDGLGESITAITSLALVFIAFETGNPAIAMMSVILLGSVLGFLPFNFPPSKILGGTAGDTNFGFLLSTLAIMSSAKLSTTLLLLSIPVLDMIYVLVRRIFEHKVANPIKLMGISGSIHLHHRLINFGFTKKHTLYMEISLFAIFALIALFFEGVGNDIFYIHIVLISLFSIFIFLSFIVKINEKRRKKRKEIKRGKVVRDVSPEERYRY